MRSVREAGGGLSRVLCAGGGVGVAFQFLSEEVSKLPHRFTRDSQEKTSGKLGRRIIHMQQTPLSPLDPSIDKA